MLRPPRHHRPDVNFERIPSADVRLQLGLGFVRQEPNVHVVHQSERELAVGENRALA